MEFFPDNPDETIPPEMTAVTPDSGLLGTWNATFFPSPIVVELYEETTSTLLSSRTVNAWASTGTDPTEQITRYGDLFLSTGQIPPLDQHGRFRVRAYYQYLPSMLTEFTIDSWTMMRSTVRPEVSTSFNEVLNTDAVSIHVKMVDTMMGDYVPPPSEQWLVRLLRQKSYNDFESLSPWATLGADGTMDIPLDLTGMSSNNFRIMAEAQWVFTSPDGDGQPRKSRNLVQIAVFDGLPIDATIAAGKLSGPAPFKTYLKVQPGSREDQLNIGSVVWEMRNIDSGGPWTVMVSDYAGSSTVMYQTFNRGRYQVRATITNKHSGETSTTPAVDIVAYLVPDVDVEGAPTVMRYPDRPTDVIFTGLTSVTEPVVWQWSIDNGETWQSATDTFVYTVDPPLPGYENTYQNIYVYGRVRYADSPPDDPYSWAVKKTGSRLVPMRPPYVRLTGPYRVELGRPQIYRGYAYPAYRGIESDVYGEFELPDGTRVPGDYLEFTPTEADVVDGKVRMAYHGTSVGFEAYDMTTFRELLSTTWIYQWPEWLLYGKPRYLYAPSSVQLYARQDRTRFPIDEPVYLWDIPTEAAVMQDRYPDRRVVQIDQPGIYDFSVDISDARGNVTTETYQVELLEPPPMTTDIIVYKSNIYDRTPLNVTLRAYATGGHPGDRVSAIEFSVDGAVVASSGSFARA
jgi:hypothetical protein